MAEERMSQRQSQQRSGDGSPTSSIMQRGATSRVGIDYRLILPERFTVNIQHRYVIGDLAVGEGGFAKVFVARDKHLDREVAVKRCSLIRPHDDEAQKDIENEIRIMCELDHPCICKLFETFEEGIHKYFIMEYCEGGELLEKINELGHISEDIAVDIISQVTGALFYAHGNSIAHRDIKPDNIVMCSKDPSDTRIKVIDWGLASNFSGNSMVQAVGAQLFAAPEVLSPGKVYDCSCDMWSLGIVTYLMTCGQMPITGDYERVLFLAKAERYLKEGPMWEKISLDARDFIRSLLKAEPSRRLTSATALRHEWCMNHKRRVSRAAGRELTEEYSLAFNNLMEFKEESFFKQLCTVAVARQLDFNKLADIHRIFRQLDTNSDGTLSYREIARGWEKINGKSNFSNKEMEAQFSYLDLNGSGAVDYTEFCAAGLGTSVLSKTDLAWTAFSALDVETSGRVRAEQLRHILISKDMEGALGHEVCQAAAFEIMDTIDLDENGQIEFDEWMGVVRRAWTRKQLTKTLDLTNLTSSQPIAETTVTDASDITATYMALKQINELEESLSGENNVES